MLDVYPNQARQYSMLRYYKYTTITGTASAVNKGCVDGGCYWSSPSLLSLPTFRFTSWTHTNAPQFRGQSIQHFQPINSCFDTLEKFNRDLEAGREALRSYLGSPFFGWDTRSTLLFWRWPGNQCTVVRDGLRPYYINHLPKNRKKARQPPKERYVQIWEKFKKTLVRIYLLRA